MRTVGIRELKNRFSEYLREVRRGERVLVTDRGEVVAEFSLPRIDAVDSRAPAALLAMAQRGVITLGNSVERLPYEAIPRVRRGTYSAKQLLDEERGSR